MANKSQIGTSYNLNKQYNFYCTNLPVNTLKNFSYGLPNNAIIISSPTDNNSYDIGTPSILMTDYNSNIIPLTYTLDSSQFIIDEKTNKAKFKTEIIDNKFTTYYTQLKQIENNINVKHDAVSYFYNNVLSYYDTVSDYYDDIEVYYNTISYYYDEIVEKYDDIINTIYDVKSELLNEIEKLKISTQNTLDDTIWNLKTTYIAPINDDLIKLNDRIKILEEKNQIPPLEENLQFVWDINNRNNALNNKNTIVIDWTRPGINNDPTVPPTMPSPNRPLFTINKSRKIQYL